MSAINSNDLSKFVGILEVAPIATPASFVRLASVRGVVANFDNTVNAVDIKADDTGTVFKGYLPEGRIEGSFLENANRDVMKLLLGGTDADIAGTPVSVTTEALGTGWTIGQPIKLANKMGDNTTVTSIVIDADGSPLTVTTDYTSYVGDGINGELGYTYIVPVTAQTGVLDADYDYTPNASESLALAISFTESPRLVVRLTATDSDGNIRRIIIDDATFEGIYGMEFLDVVEAGDLVGASFTFKASKGAIYTYYNEIL